MYIYKIENNINGKIYVGKTSTSKQNYMGSGVILKKAYEKHGSINFTKVILEEVDDISILNEREKYWIEKLKANHPGIGYNLTIGGDGFASGSLNPSHRPEVKKKISDKLSGDNNPSKRQEVRDKISSTLTGRKISDEHKLNISKGALGHNTSKGSKNSKSKSFIVIYPDGKEEEIKGLREFCRNNSLDAKLLRRTIDGRQTHHKNFKLRNVNNSSQLPESNL